MQGSYPAGFEPASALGGIRGSGLTRLGLGSDLAGLGADGAGLGADGGGLGFDAYGTSLDIEGAARFCTGGVDAELVEDRGVGLEVRQVVLLLQTGVLEQLLARGAEPGQPRRWDRIGGDDAPGQSAADVMLLDGELVVEHVHRRDTGPLGGEREVIGPVRHREVKRAARPAVSFAVRLANAITLRAREAPAWRPTTIASSPWSFSSPTVCA